MYVKPKMLTVIDFEPLPLTVPTPVIRIFITGKIRSKPEFKGENDALKKV